MDEPHEAPIVIAIGYSVRALVEACAHAGLTCMAVDHFGDADTRVFSNDRWIHLKLTEQGLLSQETESGLQAIATELHLQNKRTVFLLAGGMENLGAACEQLRSIAEVLGPNEAQRKALRDIRFLQAIATECGLRIPAMRPNIEGVSSWLWKPVLGAGGLHISRKLDVTKPTSEGYWQQFIHGESIGVSCLVDGAGVQVLGATGGLTARDWPGPLEFIYRGSYGPVALSTDCESKIELLCTRIHKCTGYSGWLQFDFVREENELEDQAELWLLECNPRWAAGMEVFLNAGRENPVRELLRHFQFELPNSVSTAFLKPPVDAADAKASFAKAVLYAVQPIELNNDSIAKLQSIDRIADLPYAPQLIEAGHPIVTVRASLGSDSIAQNEAATKLQLLEALRAQADLVWDAIAPKT